MLDILEEEMTQSKTEKSAIDSQEFVADYLRMSQSALMQKYKITSTRMMKLIREFVPVEQRYANRVRSNVNTATMTS